MTVSKDSRRSPRRSVQIECKIVAQVWDQPVVLRVSDVSPYGMWVGTEFPLEVGDGALVSFHPPGPVDRAVVALATVVRTSLAAGRSGMALQFVDVKPAAFKHLQSLVGGPGTGATVVRTHRGRNRVRRPTPRRLPAAASG